MDILKHEYLIPIVLVKEKETLNLVKKLKRIAKQQFHLFSDSFGFFQRLRYTCHDVNFKNKDLLVCDLINFSEKLEDYCFPVIIVCDKWTADFVHDNSDVIESTFVVVNYSDLSI